jgi:hypothetical protein
VAGAVVDEDLRLGQHVVDRPERRVHRVRGVGQRVDQVHAEALGDELDEAARHQVGAEHAHGHALEGLRGNPVGRVDAQLAGLDVLVEPPAGEVVLDVRRQQADVVAEPEHDLLVDRRQGRGRSAGAEHREQAEEDQLGDGVGAVVRNGRYVDPVRLGVVRVDAVLEVVCPEGDRLQLRVLVDDPPRYVDPAADDRVGPRAAFADFVLAAAGVVLDHLAGDALEALPMFRIEDH